MIRYRVFTSPSFGLAATFYDIEELYLYVQKLKKDAVWILSITRKGKSYWSEKGPFWANYGQVTIYFYEYEGIVNA